LHNSVNTRISFGLLITIVGGSFCYVYATDSKDPWMGFTAGAIISSDAPKELELGQAHGYLILTIAPSSPADRAGLRGGDPERSVTIDGRQVPIGGDIIHSMEDKQINQREDICAVLAQKQAGDSVKLEILRDGSLFEANLILGEIPASANSFC
jgi:S1-C subfamily serine protease